jgi:acetyl-CoA acetyltransferase
MSWAQPSAIVGAGESALGHVPGRSAISLQAEAVIAGLANAGISKEEVDGLVAMPSLVSPLNRPAVNLAQYVGLSSDRVRWLQSSGHGSLASSGGVVHEACMAIAAGVCETVVVVSGDNLLSPGRTAGISLLANLRDGEFENPDGTFIAATWAMTAARYMHDYDVTEADLALVAGALRDRAADHPRAQMRKPITVDDVLGSPVVSAPLHRLNCAIVSDGACAVVVESLAKARGRRRHVRVLSGEIAYGLPGGRVTDDMGQVGDPYSPRRGTRESSRRALGAAGVSLADIDLLCTYDPFSHVPLLFLEGLGYCGEGEGGQLIRDGFLDHGVGATFNLHGGLHSYCHPGNAGGLFMIVEAFRQLAGEPLGRAANSPSLGLVHGYGGNKGVFTTSVLAKGES